MYVNMLHLSKELSLEVMGERGGGRGEERMEGRGKDGGERGEGRREGR